MIKLIVLSLHTLIRYLLEQLLCKNVLQFLLSNAERNVLYWEPEFWGYTQRNACGVCPETTTKFFEKHLLIPFLAVLFIKIHILKDLLKKNKERYKYNLRRKSLYEIPNFTKDYTQNSLFYKTLKLYNECKQKFHPEDFNDLKSFCKKIKAFVREVFEMT
jgi:hypothetical protein